MREKKQKMKRKFYLVLSIGILMILGVILWSNLQAEKRNKLVESNSLQDPEKVQMKEVDGNKKIESDMKQENSKELQEGLFLEISNRKEQVDPIMGAWSYRLNEAITNYVKQHKIQANQAKCLDCIAANGSSDTVEFYLQLNDDAESIITAFYNTNTMDIRIQTCQYTEEEIADKIWEGDAPLIRDVPETEKGGIEIEKSN